MPAARHVKVWGPVAEGAVQDGHGKEGGEEAKEAFEGDGVQGGGGVVGHDLFFDHLSKVSLGMNASKG